VTDNTVTRRTVTRKAVAREAVTQAVGLPRTSFLQQVSTLVRKDMLLEWRSRSRFVSVLLFGVVTLVLFSFAVGPDTNTMRDIAGGFLVLALLLSSTLGLSESFRSEQQHRAFEGLTLLPVDSIALFYGKAISNTLFLLLLAPILIPVAIVLYSVELSLSSLAMLFLLWAMTAAGLSAPGTLYAAMTSRVESQDVLLPVLLFPLVTPLLLASVKAAGLVLDGDPMTQLQSWFIMLLAFNGIFWSLAGILFPFLDAEGL
jgi:heme exporter protein B